jgi:hypothetical protein
MKKSQETFRILADSICSSPSYANAARRAGISESSLWSWIAASQRGEPGFTLDEYVGEQDMPLHECLKIARKMAMMAVVQNLEHRALNGHTEQSYYKGQPQYELDPALLSWSDEELRALGMDRYKRDANGNLIPVLLKFQPPVALALAVASAHWPKLYGARSEVNVNVKGSLGVTTVDKRKPKPSPPQVQVIDPPRQIEPPADLGDDDLSDILGPAEPSAETTDDVETATAAPMARQPKPAPTIATKYGVLTPQQAAILDRLRAGTPASAPTRPSAIAQKFSASECDDDTRPLPKAGSRIV